MKLTYILLIAVVGVAIEAKSVKKSKAHHKKKRHETLADNYKLNRIKDSDCKDVADDCKAFGKLEKDDENSCFNNPDKARNECPVSCKLCVSKRSKKQSDYMGGYDLQPQQCSQQSCYETPQWSVQNCAVTCQLCQPGVSSGPVDQDVRCPFWGQYGYCSQQQQQQQTDGYISNNCPFSCNTYGSAQPAQQPYPYPIEALSPYQPNAMPTPPQGVTPAPLPPYFQQQGYGYPQQPQPTQPVQPGQTQAPTAAQSTPAPVQTTPASGKTTTEAAEETTTEAAAEGAETTAAPAATQAPAAAGQEGQQPAAGGQEPQEAQEQEGQQPGTEPAQSDKSNKKKHKKDKAQKKSKSHKKQH
ncbi:predicted protein [Nematostella vectensis]|uniref:Nematocyst expressed protein 3 n=1 Tax=Nematostella vectensis TaxID=45351 RepID=NEP3_NEMVE|nr:RecName: Full=Nematocyst expressed protein 3; Short=NEP-3; Short=NEP3; Flags: Precursor [Nematostella vectensis]EDO48496.1 predicted protein [Nematostella vectensis]|eukprot:XP_001640559.1 predicted protein [Nematostella vectensis]